MILQMISVLSRAPRELLGAALLLAGLAVAAPAARAQADPGLEPGMSEPGAPEPGMPDGGAAPESEPAPLPEPSPEPALPELPIVPTGTAAPPGGFDMEAYAAQLLDVAKAAAVAGEGAKVTSHVKYLKGPLGQTQLVKRQAKVIDDLERRGVDLQAEAVLKRAEELAPKNPAKAKEKLQELRGSYGATGFVAQQAARIEKIETEVRTALWGGKGAWRGNAVLPAEGVLRLTYELEGVPELADWECAGKSAPKLEAGRLALVKADGIVRHRLDVPEGASFTAEVTARGAGKVAIVVDGTAPEGTLGSKAAIVEVDATAAALTASIGRLDEKGRPQATLARAAGGTAASPWRVRVERRGGVVRVTLAEGMAEPASATAQAAPAAEPPKGATAERAPSSDELMSAPHGRALKVGLSAMAGKVEFERIVIEGPLPKSGPAGEAAASRPPLPTKVWIPLSKKGKDDWKEQGKWTYEGELIRQSNGGASIVSKEIEGRDLEKYTFTVDVKLDKEDGRRPRMQQPMFAIVLPVADSGVAWIFTPREMRLDGVDDTRLLGTLTPEQWQTLVVKVDAKVVECFVGQKKIFSVPRDKIEGSRYVERASGISFRTFPGIDKIELKAPKIRIDP